MNCYTVVLKACGIPFRDLVRVLERNSNSTRLGPWTGDRVELHADSEYGTIGDVNAEWGTSYAGFGDIEVPLLSNMNSAENPARWVDFRLFMEQEWASAYIAAHRAVREAYPDVNMSFTNPYKYSSLSGTNFALWAPHEEIQLRYCHRHVLDPIRSWSDSPVLSWEYHIHDCRAGTRLGKLHRLSLVLRPGEPHVLALLPYEPTGIQATASFTDESLTVRASLSSDAEPSDHIFHVSVTRPGEAEPFRCYTRSVTASRGRAEITIPLALNDPGGEWTVEVRDVVTGLATITKAVLAK